MFKNIIIVQKNVTAFFIACECGHVDVAKELQIAGSDVNVTREVCK